MGENPYYGGGGGYVQGGGSGSPYGGGGGSQGDQSPGGKKRGGNATIRPVTIKQALNASQTHPDADFMIDNVEISQILLIGSVRNQSVSATNVSYEIGDGTGYIDVRLWLDSADDEGGKMEGVSQDKYVSIMGTLKTFGGKRHVSATHIRPIEDHNEINHHLLKALYVSMKYRHPSGVSVSIHSRVFSSTVTVRFSFFLLPSLPPISISPVFIPPTSSFPNYLDRFSSPMYSQSPPIPLLPAHSESLSPSLTGLQNGNGSTSNDYASTTNTSNNHDAWSHLDPLSRDIMQFISTADTEDGYHVGVIAKQLSGKSDVGTIQQKIEDLIGDGLLYSTLDEFHCAVCAM
ncbi:replication factor A2, partial [Tremellales sp. Uapishka_1]